MGSKTRFKCDFCDVEIVNATKQGARGYCRKDGDGGWVHNLYRNMEGPHICEECVQSLIKSKAFNN